MGRTWLAAGGLLESSKLWLLATAILGAGFLCYQAYEFTSFVHEGLNDQDQSLRILVLHAHRISRCARDRRRALAA